jgi:hypothetical protein
MTSTGVRAASDITSTLHDYKLAISSSLRPPILTVVVQGEWNFGRDTQTSTSQRCSLFYPTQQQCPPRHTHSLPTPSTSSPRPTSAISSSTHFPTTSSGPPTGTSSLSGRYEGKHEHITKVLQPLYDWLEASPKPEVKHMIVGGERAAVQFRSEDARGLNGTDFDMRYCWPMRVADGHITEAVGFTTRKRCMICSLDFNVIPFHEFSVSAVGKCNWPASRRSFAIAAIHPLRSFYFSLIFSPAKSYFSSTTFH